MGGPLLDTRDVSVPNPSGHMVEQIRADEEGVENPTAAIQADESELIRQADALRNVVCQGQAEEEIARQQCEDIAQELDRRRVESGRWRWRKE